MKDRPTILSREVKGHHAVLNVRIDPDIIFFKGHFESHPILPGVTQIHWVSLLGQELFGLTGQFAGMEAVKFKDPILPGSSLVMTLEWHESSRLLHFKCRSDTAVHSSGRIRFSG